MNKKTIKERKKTIKERKKTIKERKKTKTGIFQNPAALRPNSLFYEYKKNSSFKQTIDNLVNVKERKGKKNGAYLLFTKKETVSASKPLKGMPLEIEKKECKEEYILGNAHLTLYQSTQHSDNPKKKNRPEGGHDFFSAYHVTTYLLLDNETSHEVRLYCDYRGAGKIIVKKVKGKNNQVIKTLPSETEKTLQVYLQNLFSDVLHVLQNEVLSKEKLFLSKEKELSNYLESHSEKQSLTDFSIKELQKYNHKLKELRNLGKNLVRSFNFAKYQTAIEYFSKVISFIEKAISEATSVDQSAANNNQVIQEKEKIRIKPPKKKPSTSDNTINHNPIQKHIKSPKQTSEEWFLQEYKRMNDYKQQLMASAAKDNKDIEPFKALLDNKHYHDYINQPVFLSNLFMTAIENANQLVMIYLAQQFKILKDYSKMSAFPGRNKPLIQLVFYLAVNNNSFIDIFIWLLENDFYYSLNCLWKHENSQGKMTNLFPASLACELNALDLLDPMFKFGDASLTPNISIFFKSIGICHVRYIFPDLDEGNRGVLTLAAENLWFDALFKLYSLAPTLSSINDTDQQILKFTTRYTSTNMLSHFSENYTYSGLKKIIRLMEYLSDRNLIDFYEPTVSHRQSIGSSSLSTHTTDPHHITICNQAIFLGYPELLELILNKQSIPSLEAPQQFIKLSTPKSYVKMPLYTGIRVFCLTHDSPKDNSLFVGHGDRKKIALLLLNHFSDLPYEKAKNIYTMTTYHLCCLKNSIPLTDDCDNLLTNYMLKFNRAYYNIQKKEGLLRENEKQVYEVYLVQQIADAFNQYNNQYNKGGKLFKYKEIEAYYHFVYLVDYFKTEKEGDIHFEITYFSHLYQMLYIEFNLKSKKLALSKVQKRLADSKCFLKELEDLCEKNKKEIENYYEKNAATPQNKKKDYTIPELIEGLKSIVMKAKTMLKLPKIPPLEHSFQLKSRKIHQRIENAKNEDKKLENILELFNHNQQYKQNKIFNVSASLLHNDVFLELPAEDEFKTDNSTDDFMI